MPRQYTRKIVSRSCKQVRELEARVRTLEAGLVWYADQDNYLGHCPATLDDLGARARAALAGESLAHDGKGETDAEKADADRPVEVSDSEVNDWRSP